MVGEDGLEPPTSYLKSRRSRDTELPACKLVGRAQGKAKSPVRQKPKPCFQIHWRGWRSPLDNAHYRRELASTTPNGVGLAPTRRFLTRTSKKLTLRYLENRHALWCSLLEVCYFLVSRIARIRLESEVTNLTEEWRKV